VEDPSGPSTGSQRITRGGSYICHASYCRRYRVSARSANMPDDQAGRIGPPPSCAPVGSEVAPAVEVLGNIRPGELIERNALRSWIDQLDDGSVWNTETCSNFHAAVLQLDDGLFELWHTEKEDGLIAMEMLGEQYRRRLRVQANHSHPGPEGLNGENQLGAQSSGEVHNIRRDITAWEINKLQSAEHNI
jgi:hypothetical protein